MEEARAIELYRSKNHLVDFCEAIDKGATTTSQAAREMGVTDRFGNNAGREAWLMGLVNRTPIEALPRLRGKVAQKYSLTEDGRALVSLRHHMAASRREEE